MSGLLFWYNEEGPGRAEEGTGRARSRPSLLAVPNVTAYPLKANVPITVLLYNGPLEWLYSVVLMCPLQGCRHYDL